MQFLHAIQSCLKRYCKFSGRAARSEFGCVMLFCVLLNIAMLIVDRAVFGIDVFRHVFPLDLIVYFATLVPSIAVSVRRLHDLNRSGWWILLFFAGPGIILLIIWDCSRGTLGENRFGPDPLAQIDDGHEPPFSR